MAGKGFQVWLSAARGLTRAQRREALAVLSGRSEGEASKAAIELGVDEARRCPHCSSEGAVSRGMARGLRRYQCKGCGRTFNALSGTPLSGLHHKERWLSFGAFEGLGGALPGGEHGVPLASTERPGTECIYGGAGAGGQRRCCPVVLRYGSSTRFAKDALLVRRWRKLPTLRRRARGSHEALNRSMRKRVRGSACADGEQPPQPVEGVPAAASPPAIWTTT